MRVEFVVNDGTKYINTINGFEIDPDDYYAIKRLESRNNVLIDIVKGSCFYKYDVIVVDNKIVLTVYECTYNNGIMTEPVYIAEASPFLPGVKEEGDFDIEFWHNFFASRNNKHNEAYVHYYSLIENHMEVVRTLFNNCFQNNIFCFLEMYKHQKKYKRKTFNTDIFNIPSVKINKNVGKIYDGRVINYAIQREIELDDEVFFDVTVITGPVENGVMDIQDKHRYFITEGYVYSPDGGDLGVFVRNDTYGSVHCTNMGRKYPNLMLEKYKNGKYFYQYFFSRGFIPCFEILAKAGYVELADIFLDTYYSHLLESDSTGYSDGNMGFGSINIYGKNDKEIFGFKLNKLKNIPSGAYYVHYSNYYNNRHKNADFIGFIRNVKTLNDRAPQLLEEKNISEAMFRYMCNRGSSITKKELEYVRTLTEEQYSLYEDYLRMAKNTNKYPGGLYPKSLKQSHDVLVTYINQLREAKNNLVFEEAVQDESYLSLLYEEPKYSILAPRTANDLVNESYQLSHCVRSYISRVATRQTRIYFMRLNLQKAKPLITIEVNGDRIVQVRGKANREPNGEENNFVYRWAIEKSLVY